MVNYIYHELQDSSLCGQHCLNNLLQEEYYNPINLSSIAHELDAQEREILNGGVSDVNGGDGGMGGLGESVFNLLQGGYNGYGGQSQPQPQSANVDEAGNFSIQVLRLALKRTHNIELQQRKGHTNNTGTNTNTNDPLMEKGFIVNRSNHWFTIRKIHTHWWNLNSTLERPEYISDFYLDAYLTQLIQDGYDVFTAVGLGVLDYNSNNSDNSDSDHVSSEMCKWYTETELMSGSGSNNNTNNNTTNGSDGEFSSGGGRYGTSGGNNANANNTTPTYAAFSGVGNRLGGGNSGSGNSGTGNSTNIENTMSQVSDSVDLSSFRVDGSSNGNGNDDEEDMEMDLDLARAISMSLNSGGSSSGTNSNGTSGNGSGSGKDTAAEMREKRLAALQKRGL